MAGFSTGYFFAFILVFLVSTTIHGYIIAFVASRIGDSKPRAEGRMRLSLYAHHEPLGLVLSFIGSLSPYYAFIGWGKPIKINQFGIRGGKWGQAFVFLCGLLSFFVIGTILWFAFQGLIRSTTGPLQDFLIYLVLVNFVLFAFNLLPVPPLDGYWIFKWLLNRIWDERQLQTYEEYGPIILIVIIIFLPFLFNVVGLPNPLYSFFIQPIVRALAGLLGISSI